MKFSQTEFDDLLVIKNSSFRDVRGCLKKFFYSDFFIQFNFKVDDIYTTISKENTIRGIHHQISPYGQAKLVTCLSGSFLDVAVDLRKGRQTYGKVFTYKLVADSDDQLLIPAGFSHGTLSLEDNTTMLSICSGRYLPEFESGINMKSIDLPYDTSRSIISTKDIALPELSSIL